MELIENEEPSLARTVSSLPREESQNVKGKLQLEGRGEHDFSIELASSEQLRGVSISRNKCQRVLLEGTLGELVRISLVESVMLEIQCSQGTLRMDLTEDEYRKAATKGVATS